MILNPWTLLNKYMQLAGGWEITRRYFVMNGFDGILTIFGVAMSMYLTGISSPLIVITSGIGTSIAIGISGFWIAFLTEEAEQSKEQKEIENAIFMDLDETLFARAARVAAIVNSVIDGLSPSLFGLIVLAPFFLVNLHVIPMTIAYYVSFGLTAILLFTLGLFLGALSQENIIAFGVKTLLAGLMVAGLIYLTGFEG